MGNCTMSNKKRVPNESKTNKEHKSLNDGAAMEFVKNWEFL